MSTDSANQDDSGAPAVAAHSDAFICQVPYATFHFQLPLLEPVFQLVHIVQYGTTETHLKDKAGPYVSSNPRQQAREQFADILNAVAFVGHRVLLHCRGKDVAAVVSADDLALLEALEDRMDV